jgi:large subunit ribosomal protein L1
MAHISKRYKAIDKKIDRNKTYSLAEAIALIKETATAKFDESVDVAINLGIDARKSDQAVRGSVVLPEGTGKVVHKEIKLKKH